MGLNDTPSGERVRIGIFGLTNTGKSSVMNAIANQKISMVSEVSGTTTDPVNKAMELLPLGPVLLTDTPGLLDGGILGKEREKRTREVLAVTDIALVIKAAGEVFAEAEIELLRELDKSKIPYILVLNKTDGLNENGIQECQSMDDGCIEKNYAELSGKGFKVKREQIVAVSALKGHNIELLKNMLAKINGIGGHGYPIISDLIKPKEIVLLVVPIDKAAPKGRLILPQQMTIRELLDKGAWPVVTRESELPEILEKLKGIKPDLVITDSQVFGEVDEVLPKDIKLTSFSILMARHKGIFEQALRGCDKLDKIQDGDRVLISEGCTHHRQCGDIGTVKLPAMIRNYTGKKVEFEFTSGMGFPASEELNKYALCVHCGGCMLSPKEVKRRFDLLETEGICAANYGMIIAKVKGILERAIEICV